MSSCLAVVIDAVTDADAVEMEVEAVEEEEEVEETLVLTSVGGRAMKRISEEASVAPPMTEVAPGVASGVTLEGVPEGAEEDAGGMGVEDGVTTSE